MLVPIAYGLAILLSLAIIAIGVRFLVVPRAAAAGYGIRAEESGDAAYLAVKGLRDASDLTDRGVDPFPGPCGAAITAPNTTAVPLRIHLAGEGCAGRAAGRAQCPRRPEPPRVDYSPPRRSPPRRPELPSAAGPVKASPSW